MKICIGSDGTLWRTKKVRNSSAGRFVTGLMSKKNNYNTSDNYDAKEGSFIIGYKLGRDKPHNIFQTAPKSTLT